MRILILSAVLFLSGVSVAVAGPNVCGTLIVHDEGTYTSDPDQTPSPPVDCHYVDNNGPVDAWRVWWVYAAFPTGSSPRLKALAWGIEFGQSVYVLDGGLPDPDMDFEITQGGWPHTSGAAIGEAFGEVQTGLIDACYWFAGYAAAAGGSFSTGPHATQASLFVDDTTPGHEDLIAGFSSLGFGFDGVTICPDDLSGACCFADGSCQFLLTSVCLSQGGTILGRDVPCEPSPCHLLVTGACCWPGGWCAIFNEPECESQGGQYQGDGTDCQPIPCPPLVEGACCLADGTCLLLTQTACAQQGGLYQGNLVDCIPDPCPYPSPVERARWGRIKALYREPFRDRRAN